MSDKYEKTIPHMYDWKVTAGIKAIELIDLLLKSVGARHDKALAQATTCKDNLDTAGQQGWREIGIGHIMTIARYRERRRQLDARIEGWVTGREPQL